MIRFGFIFIFLIIGLFVGYFLFSPDTNPSDRLQRTSNVNWEFDQVSNSWIVSGDVPECVNPFIIDSPVDVGKVSGVLYPGQTRGEDYKPHGGFRFDDLGSNDVEVRAIMDGKLVKASRYLSDGEEQILIFYINDCGVMAMHDHILKPSEKLKKALEQIPVNGEGDSRTTFVDSSVFIKKGDLLAEEVGFEDYEGSKNIFIDFGLYDLRSTNGFNYGQDFIRSNSNIQEYGFYGLCWLSYLNSEDKGFLEALPAGGSEGKVSDYCN